MSLAINHSRPQRAGSVSDRPGSPLVLQRSLTLPARCDRPTEKCDPPDGPSLASTPGSLLALLLAACLCAGIAADVPAAPTLDELLDLPAAPRVDPAGEPAAGDAPSAFELDEQVAQELTAQQAADTFAQAIRQMRQVSQRMADRHDIGLDIQRTQAEIIQKLDQIIAAARQPDDASQGGSGAGGGADASGSPQDTGQLGNLQQGGAGQGEGSNQQAAGSGDGDGGGSTGGGAPTEGQAQPLGQHRAGWGNLPPRLRSELDQGSGERYSPIYRDLTEAYYRRLAEETE